MAGADWLRANLEQSVAQGIGSWLQTNDPELGEGVYAWEGGPKIRLFSEGFAYDGDSIWRARYDELTALHLLDLRALMKAQKTPQELVEFKIDTASGPRALTLPLYVYTAVASVLGPLSRGEMRAV